MLFYVGFIIHFSFLMVTIWWYNPKIVFLIRQTDKLSQNVLRKKINKPQKIKSNKNFIYLFYFRYVPNCWNVCLYIIFLGILSLPFTYTNENHSKFSKIRLIKSNKVIFKTKHFKCMIYFINI